MFKKSMLVLAVLGLAASASGAFAAEGPNETAMHRHHRAAAHAVETTQLAIYPANPWGVLPEGWPHTP